MRHNTFFELKQRAAPRRNEVVHFVRSRRRRGRGTVAGDIAHL
jgi:hypothetical protein